MGLIVNVPFPESEVTQVIQDVVQNGIVRGTKEYNKDKYISGAVAQSSSPLFPEWASGGKVFYKVRLGALDPRNFKDSTDVGTLAVRYVVQPQGEKNTVLHIDAIFVEDFRHVAHLSNGSVESAEYADIHQRLDDIALMKAETEEAEREKKEKQEKLEKKRELAITDASDAMDAPPTPAPLPVSADTAKDTANLPRPASAIEQPDELTLEQHVQDLRRQVERLVKSPGAPLKSAPFHTASTLQSLPAGAEVLILIATPYWLGVETHEGQHGWIPRDQLELLP